MHHARPRAAGHLPGQRRRGQAQPGWLQGLLGPEDETCIDTAHRLWANSGVPGELSQVLPSPRHFEQASQLVSREMTRDAIAYGADADRHVAAFKPFVAAGYDEIYVSQMGGSLPPTSYRGFFDFYRELLPQLRALA